MAQASTKDLTAALLRARGLSCVHKVLANTLELVTGVPTTRIGGPTPPHANWFSIWVTWKDSPGDTGTFL